MKIYANYLKKFNANKSLEISYQLITEEFISKITAPFILYVDWFDFEKYTHAPHFIVIEKQDINYITILDPWRGIKTKVSRKMILKSVMNLKTVLGFSPLLITLNAKEKYE
jgi:hypothetical protein